MAIAREVASVTRLGIEVVFLVPFVGRNLVLFGKLLYYLTMAIIFLFYLLDQPFTYPFFFPLKK